MKYIHNIFLSGLAKIKFYLDICYLHTKRLEASIFQKFKSIYIIYANQLPNISNNPGVCKVSPKQQRMVLRSAVSPARFHSCGLDINPDYLLAMNINKNLLNLDDKYYELYNKLFDLPLNEFELVKKIVQITIQNRSHYHES